jgi:hypothetical protein
LCNALAKLSVQTGEDWDTHLNDVLYAYKIRKHTATGKSPYEMMYGITPKLPNGILLGPEFIPEERKKNMEQIRTEAKQPTVKKKSRFKEDQLVLWKSGLRRNKMEQNLYGPYIISKCGPNNTYILIDDYGNEIPTLISGDRLQKYQTRAKGIGRRTVVPRN